MVFFHFLAVSQSCNFAQMLIMEREKEKLDCIGNSERYTFHTVICVCYVIVVIFKFSIFLRNSWTMLPIKTWSNLLLIYFILNGSLPIVTSKSRSRRAIAPRIQSDTYREHFQHVVNIRVHNVPLGPPYEQDCSGFLVKYKNKPFLITNAHCFKDLLNPRISDRYPYFDMLVIAGRQSVILYESFY